MSITDYDTLGADSRDIAQLRSAAQTGLPGALVLVTGADTGLAFTAAALTARNSVHVDHVTLDVHLAVPDADRWTIGEVDEKILRPARLKAFDRTHVVVADADHMSQAAHDHVLKTVEEPTSGAQFWFVVSDPERLPITIRGRASAILTVRPAPAEQRIPLLRAAGADEAAANEIVALCGDDMRLALAVAAAPDLLADLRLYATETIRATDPTRAADHILGSVLRLAAAFPALPEPAGAEPSAAPTTRRRAAKARPPKKAAPSRALRPRWDSLPPAARPDGRRMVRNLLERWTREEKAALASASGIATVRGHDKALRALAAARAELGTNAPASTVLPALRSRASG